MKNNNIKKKTYLILKKKNEKYKLGYYIPIISFIISAYLYFFKNFPMYNYNTTLGGLLPINIVIGFFSLAYTSYFSKNALSDNVLANKAISPFVFAAIVGFLHFSVKVPMISSSPKNFYGAIGSGFVFIFVYLYASSYFQPDLDVSGNRPGMTHFPTGLWIRKYRIGRFFKWLFNTSIYSLLNESIPSLKKLKKSKKIKVSFIPFGIIHPLKILYLVLDFSVTSFWYNLWTPYATLFTHRGIGHWPIIGVYLRLLYLKIIIFPFEFFIKIPLVSDYLDMFFPTSAHFMSFYWLILCLPIFLSDLIHIFVDYIDAVKRGVSFCPKGIPRGLLYQIFFKK